MRAAWKSTARYYVDSYWGILVADVVLGVGLLPVLMISVPGYIICAAVLTAVTSVAWVREFWRFLNIKAVGGGRAIRLACQADVLSARIKTAWKTCPDEITTKAYKEINKLKKQVIKQLREREKMQMKAGGPWGRPESEIEDLTKTVQLMEDITKETETYVQNFNEKTNGLSHQSAMDLLEEITNKNEMLELVREQMRAMEPGISNLAKNYPKTLRE